MFNIVFFQSAISLGCARTERGSSCVSIQSAIFFNQFVNVRHPSDWISNYTIFLSSQRIISSITKCPVRNSFSSNTALHSYPVIHKFNISHFDLSRGRKRNLYKWIGSLYNNMLHKTLKSSISKHPSLKKVINVQHVSSTWLSFLHLVLKKFHSLKK